MAFKNWFVWCVVFFNCFRDEFIKICKNEVKVPGLIIMKDVAIVKTEFVPDQKAVSKIQNFGYNEELFRYCTLPQVREEYGGCKCSSFVRGLENCPVCIKLVAALTLVSYPDLSSSHLAIFFIQSAAPVP